MANQEQDSFVKRLLGAAQTNRAVFTGRQVQGQQAQQNRQQFQGRYVGMDDGKAQVQLFNGAIVGCTSQTNGAIGLGDVLSVYRPRQGEAYISGLPAS